MKNFFFRIVRSDEGCRSYMLADRQSRQGLIWDPALPALDTYIELVSEWGLKEVLVADSHTHADHFSATSELAMRLHDKVGIKIAMGEKTNSKRPSIRWRDGEQVELGPDFRFTVLATPGHTEDGICLFANFHGKNLLLSSDTLMIGSVGRTDFPGASADQLYESLHVKIANLPNDTWIFPAHDYSGLLFSRLDVEKKLNLQFKMDKDEFVLFKQNEVLDGAPIVPKIVEFNCAEKPRAPMVVPAAATCARSGPAPTVRTIGTDELKSLIAEKDAKAAYVDVREQDEFRNARIPGLQNIPMSLMWSRISDFEDKETVYFSCQSGRRSGMVTATLMRLGAANVVNIAGGIQGWMARGYHVDSGAV